MKLSELLRDRTFETLQTIDTTIDITDISTNSKQIKKGNLFIAVKGEQADGHTYIDEAIERGAAAIVIEDRGILSLYSDRIPVIIVENTRRFYARLLSIWFLHPSRNIKVIGITGTNGKTTVSFLLQHILNNSQSCGLLSTVLYDTGNRQCVAQQTTPDAAIINQLLAEMHNNDLAYCAMEVSSHALSQHRVYGIDFHAAIFTNLTQDHLDYHHGMEEYFLSKTVLFSPLEKDISANDNKNKTTDKSVGISTIQSIHNNSLTGFHKDIPRRLSIINIDDAYGQRLCSLAKGRVVTYGVSSKADFTATDIDTHLSGVQFAIQVKDQVFPVKSRLIGIHNVYNILAAFSYAYEEGISPQNIIQAIESFSGVCGRMEALCCGQPFHVFVDYAHTPDAFQVILSSIKKLSQGKVIAVFGCGGNRDQEKRPLMGEIASRFADYVVLTNDNPRFEDEEKIIYDIEKGFAIKRPSFSYDIIPDRKDAIEKALLTAQPDDIVLILGKGHEDSIMKQGKKHSFSDQKVAEETLQRMFKKHPLRSIK
ncbi:MAG: UDP-N-acetylmuramoyl-L-alanyl-D-glutamate--2,6-diaminopimelate ligase [Candidatus Omnitrophota bacterium]